METDYNELVEAVLTDHCIAADIIERCRLDIPLDRYGIEQEAIGVVLREPQHKALRRLLNTRGKALYEELVLSIKYLIKQRDERRN